MTSATWFLVVSLLIQLRCQVHTELAKCEEDLEQIQVAMEHLKKVSQSHGTISGRKVHEMVIDLTPPSD